jgi:hypothetical protein
MARIAGISTQKNTKDCKEGISLEELDNRLTSHINKLPWNDARKKGNKKLGLTTFEKECENALSVEEARSKTISFVKSLPWKK